MIDPSNLPMSTTAKIVMALAIVGSGTISASFIFLLYAWLFPWASALLKGWLQ